jgi:UDP-3-O-[3-hydroxymyristoyl] glucosamine N-acyltransferase
MPKSSKRDAAPSFTLLDLADALGGTVEGDPSLVIRGVGGISEAGDGDITFLANPKYESQIETTRALAVIVGERFDRTGLNLIRVPNPYLAFSRALSLFHPPPERIPEVSPEAHIAPGAKIDPGATILPFSFIDEGAEIGAGTVISPFVFVGRGSSVGPDSLIHPNVTIREGVSIGHRVIIHSGTVIGSDGFGYARDGEVQHKIPQLGGVVIEDDVELGAGVTVDRGTIGNTRIGRGTKVDNLVQIAHNVIIGENSILVSQVGISGSTKIGRAVTLAGQVGVVGHIEIGDRTIVGAQSGVSKSLPADGAFSGSPTLPHRQFLKVYGSLKYLPEMRREIRRLSDIVKKLEGAAVKEAPEPSGGDE